jgi:acyl-CoA thioester hydrolase
MVVHSHNDYFGSISFPAVAELGLRVNQLGRSSVRYEIALFERGVEEVRAVGEFVHVFVDRATKRPAAGGMPRALRDGLSKILVGTPDSKL